MHTYSEIHSLIHKTTHKYTCTHVYIHSEGGWALEQTPRWVVDSVTAPVWQSSGSFWTRLSGTWCDFWRWCCARSWTLMILVGPFHLRIFCNSTHKCTCMYIYCRKGILHFCVPTPSGKGVERCDGGPSSTGCWWQWRCTMCQVATRVLFVLVTPTPAAMTDKSFKGYLFGVTRRKLFPMLGFNHRVSGCPSSPLWGLRGSKHLRVPLWSCLQALCGAWLAHFGIKPLHSHLHPGANINSLFLCSFDFVSMSTAYLFLCFPFPLILIFTLNMLTHWVLLHWTKLFN